jgi:hypothetical protein
MYRGNNPTALTSQQMFSHALSELLKKKEFKDISVSELCKFSGVSRQTFYSLFGTKENILLYQLDNSPALTDKTDPKDCSNTVNDICYIYVDLVTSNYSTLQMIVDDGLTSVLGELLICRLSLCSQIYMDCTAEERSYAIEFISAGLCALTRKYIVKHPQPNKGELLRLSLKTISYFGCK